MEKSAAYRCFPHRAGYDRRLVKCRVTCPVQSQSSVAAFAESVHGPSAMGCVPHQLEARELELFAAAGQRVELVSGRAVFRRGEYGRGMFVVESGRILVQFAGGLPDKLIGPGEYFGELALFVGNHARSGSALATEPSVVYLVGPDAFGNLLRGEPLRMAQFMLRSFAHLVAGEQQLIANYRRRGENLMRALDSQCDPPRPAQHQTCTDELTGLSNRRGLYQFLENMAELRERHCHFGLLLIGVDRLKQINHHSGHLIGDEVLSAIAFEIRIAAGATDLPCRLGGDEFALLGQVRDRRELAGRALRIAEAVRRLRFSKTAPELTVSVSVGGGLCHEDGAWPRWYSEADFALCHVKGSGGDGVHVMS